MGNRFEEIIKKAKRDTAARKAQQNAAARKAQQDAVAAAAEKNRIEAINKAAKTNQEAIDKAKKESIDKATQEAIKQAEILNKNKTIPVSISTIGNEIKKQKEQVENNLKLLTYQYH